MGPHIDRGQISNMADQSRPENNRIDTRVPRHISFMTCDNNVLWINCTEGFRRKFVDEYLNVFNLPCDHIPYNDKYCQGTHICYWVHGRADDCKTSCKLSGGHLIQPSANSPANVFNSIYWRRCDSTYRNALDETLKHEDGSDLRHTMFRVKLAEVLTPLRGWQAPKHRAVQYQNDLAKFEKYKDAYVVRFM